MIDLLNSYQPKDILIFIVVLALAVKGVITFYEWAHTKLKAAFGKEISDETSKKDMEEKISNTDKTIGELKESIETLTKQIDTLVQSDREDIKSFLTRQHHHYCYKQGWIDDYSLECCEKRYKYYTEEGGNSFIAGFMDELRALPKLPPTAIKNIGEELDN